MGLPRLLHRILTHHLTHHQTPIKPPFDATSRNSIETRVKKPATTHVTTKVRIKPRRPNSPNLFWAVKFCCLPLPPLVDMDANHQQTAYIAAGCFWSVQLILDRIVGVGETEVGYCGGRSPTADYHSVCSGSTGHAEAVKIEYDPSKTSLRDILRQLFLQKDVTVYHRQGNDVGSQYRSGVWFTSEAQRREIEELRDDINRSIAKGTYHGPASGTTWQAEIAPAGAWHRGERYHQKYLENGRGRSGIKQSARKQCTNPVICYG